MVDCGPGTEDEKRGVKEEVPGALWGAGADTRSPVGSKALNGPWPFRIVMTVDFELLHVWTCPVIRVFVDARGLYGWILGDGREKDQCKPEQQTRQWPGSQSDWEKLGPGMESRNWKEMYRESTPHPCDPQKHARWRTRYYIWMLKNKEDWRTLWIGGETYILYQTNLVCYLGCDIYRFCFTGSWLQTLWVLEKS